VSIWSVAVVIETVFLVPLRDNDGRPFPQAAWTELHERLLGLGGYSQFDGVVGAWVSEGRVFRDVSRQYTVSLGSLRQLPAWLEVVEWVRLRFAQEAIYVKVGGIVEILGPAET
jgi:hypothetical protein